MFRTHKNVKGCPSSCWQTNGDGARHIVPLARLDSLFCEGGQEIFNSPVSNYKKVGIGIVSLFDDDTSADIATLVELNVDWSQVPSYDLLSVRSIGWWSNSHWAYSYNRRTPSTSTKLYSGTAILTIADTTCHLWSGFYNDPTGLGLWTGQRYQGRGQHFITVVSA